jgi:hypothetical protein
VRRPATIRFELRASREQKGILAAAAAYERMELTGFLMRTALPAAEEIVALGERIVLTPSDSDALCRGGLLRSAGPESRGKMKVLPVNHRSTRLLMGILHK